MVKPYNSVQFKFLFILLPGVVAALLLSLIYSGYTSEERFEKDLAQKRVTVASYSMLLAEPLWHFDSTAIENAERALMQDPDVLQIEVYDEGNNLVSIRKSDLLGLVKSTTVIESPIIYRNAHINQRAGALKVTVGQARLEESMKRQMDEMMVVLLLLVVAIFIGAWLIQKRVIGIPLQQMMLAIQSSNQDERFVKVNWNSDDELGEIIGAFNEMQDALKTNHLKLTASENRFRSLYHNTPALLFTLSRDGHIIDASNYFLDYLGYEKQDVVNHPLRDLLTRDSVDYHSTTVLQELSSSGYLHGQPLEVRKSNNEVIDVLVHAVSQSDDNRQGALSVMTDITSLKKAQAVIDRQANFDPLTDLPNRNLFQKTLEEEIQKCAEYNSMMALLFIDLDRFKCVNDTFGHSTGDTLIRMAGSRIKGVLRPEDMVARLGGDEFAVILTDVSNPYYVEEVAKRLLKKLVRPFHLADSEIFISCSVGIALYPSDALNPEQLLQNADIAMYRAKEAGRNNYQLFMPEHHVEAREQLEMEATLRKALDEEMFELHYQPIVDLNSREVVGAEALIRLRDPEKGLISPMDFIPVAEETGLIVQIGSWALHEAMSQLAQWRRQGASDLYVSVNVSTRQFQSKQFIQSVEYSLSLYEIPSEALMIEITESLLIHDNQNNLRIMEKLADQGCQIAIDDFGTGYSALSYFQKFPVNVLKIDRSFTQNCTENTAHQGLIDAIIGMSQSLNLKVITEGIETEEQLAFLESRHCQMGQGFLFSKPLPAAEFTEEVLKYHTKITA